jgi:hypothetical protein
LTPDGLMTIFGGDWYLKDVEIFDGKTWKVLAIFIWINFFYYMLQEIMGEQFI